MINIAIVILHIWIFCVNMFQSNYLYEARLMAQTTLNISIDEDVKKQFDSFCDEIGIDTTSAMNLFVKTVLREQRIPFEISLHNSDSLDDPFYSEENQNRLRISAEQMERNGGTVHELIEDYDD